MEKHSGATLIEFVMVVALMGIVLVFASRFYSQALTTVKTEQNITDAVWQGQVAIQRMVRDIRQVRSAQDISTMTSSALTFTDNTGTSVSYALSGSALTRNSIALAEGISTLNFGYKDDNNATAATASAVRYITMILTVTQNAVNYSLTTSVYLRDISS